MIKRTSSKLNLFLRVIKKRKDGYHELSSVLSETALGDTLVIEEAKEDTFFCNEKSLESGNLVIKARDIIREEYKIPSIKMELYKRVPVASGMGGGSGDAAETLKMLNEIFQLGIGRDKLVELASRVGMDVPFFIDGGIGLASGRGELVQRIAGKPAKALIVMNEPVISKNIYEMLRKEDFFETTYNTLLHPVIRNYPKVREFNNKLMSIDDRFRMTGAGGAFFIIDEEKELIKISDRVEAKFKALTNLLIPEVNYEDIIFNS